MRREAPPAGERNPHPLTKTMDGTHCTGGTTTTQHTQKVIRQSPTRRKQSEILSTREKLRKQGRLVQFSGCSGAAGNLRKSSQVTNMKALL
jgi:hypothetical protein